MFEKTIIPLQLQQLKAGEKRWIGNLQGSAAALFFKEILQLYHDRLFVIVARHQQHLAQLESELLFYGIEPKLFSDWEILPYDRLSPHQDIVSERLAMLSNLPQYGVILIAASTLMQRVAPPSWLLGEHFDIQVGAKFALAAQKQRLIQAGYHLVDTVYDPGEFAVRGSIMDIYAAGQTAPIRIDLFDDEVESLRLFDPETQRTCEKINHFRVLPAKEFPIKAHRHIFRERYAEVFPQDRKSVV